MKNYISNKVKAFCKWGFFLMLFPVLASCTEDEIDTFDEHNYLSFEKSSMTYTFAFSGDDVQSVEFEIPVVYAGRYGSTDMQFSIVDVPEKSTAKQGTDYQLMDATQQVIKSGTNTGNGRIRLMRTPGLKEASLKLVLAIAVNDNFLPGVTDTLTVDISDQIVQPEWWDYTISRYLGQYTKTKLLLWLEFMDVKDGSNPLDADQYVQWLDYGTGNFIYKSYRESTMIPKFMEFRQWLLNTKNNPIDPDLGYPVSESLGTF